MNEVITASKIVPKFSRFHGQDIFKIYYDCEHCSRTHSHGMGAQEYKWLYHSPANNIRRGSHCPKQTGDVLIQAHLDDYTTGK